MKKLNVFELKQVSGGASGEVKHIGDLIPPSTAPKDFVISLEELERRTRIAGMNGVPEHPITYEALKNSFQIPFYS